METPRVDCENAKQLEEILSRIHKKVVEVSESLAERNQPIQDLGLAVDLIFGGGEVAAISQVIKEMIPFVDLVVEYRDAGGDKEDLKFILATILNTRSDVLVVDTEGVAYPAAS